LKCNNIYWLQNFEWQVIVRINFLKKSIYLYLYMKLNWNSSIDCNFFYVWWQQQELGIWSKMLPVLYFLSVHLPQFLILVYSTQVSNQYIFMYCIRALSWKCSFIVIALNPSIHDQERTGHCGLWQSFRISDTKCKQEVF
jgi:hypothetical protein